MPLSRLFSFHGGVKPPYHKADSCVRPIALAPLPQELVIPLHQSIGGPPRPLVRAGEPVLAGQMIGGPDGTFSSAVHASTSGRVVAVEPRLMPHPSGLTALCVVIAPDGEDQWIDSSPPPWTSLAPHQVRDLLCACGIVGLGGAVFPSHLKVTTKTGDQGLDTLIINGAECEPYITCDDMQMREHAPGIIAGASILATLTRARRTFVAIEDNKPQALSAMRQALQCAAANPDCPSIDIVAIPTRYPAGGAKQLMRVLTGIEVPHGQRSTEYGLQCFNTGTAYAVHDALEKGRPMVSRVVTVAGNVRQPGNFWARLGTPMRDLIAWAGGAYPDSERIIMGGPMMGVVMPNECVPVVKATNCILVASKKLFPPPPPEMPCIRCGQCALACPADLQPFDMYWYAHAKLYGKAQEYHLFDCIECGCCAYVCPSNIPLVDYYRHAKSEIWSREQTKAAADEARERYEFRLLREERDKAEKAARLAEKAAQARQTPVGAENQDAQALIAAARARVMTTRTGEQPTGEQPFAPTLSSTTSDRAS
jgi:electron transport complex protein RnfC